MRTKSQEVLSCPKEAGEEWKLSLQNSNSLPSGWVCWCLSCLKDGEVHFAKFMTWEKWLRWEGIHFTSCATSVSFGRPHAVGWGAHLPKLQQSIQPSFPLHPDWALKAPGFQRAFHLSSILQKKVGNEGVCKAQPSVGIWHAAPMGEHLNLQLLFCSAPAHPGWMSTRDSDADQGRLVLSPVPTATLDISALTGSVHGLREPRFSQNPFPTTPLRMEPLPCCWTGQGRAGSG